jgi:3-hydroxyacyl-CoA dehydrogenase
MVPAMISPAVEDYIKWAEAEAQLVPGLDHFQARPVGAVGIIGGGTMGTGIAVAHLMAGIPVTLVERDRASLDRAGATIRKTLENNVASGRVTAEAGEAALRCLTLAIDMAALATADLVIEAAFETMEVKQAIFAELDGIARAGAILASNTSYLDIEQIASATSRPMDVVGLHFFSPANIMKLLEIVRTPATAPDVLTTALSHAVAIGKKPVVANNAFGFIGNRMLAVRRMEAESIILEGVTPDRVDRVVEAFGFRMGPFRMGDLAGLDLGWSPDTSSGSTVRERLCEAGRRGQKTGAGFYDYDDQRKPVVSAQALDIISGFAADHGVAAREWSDAAILDRMLLPMIDEGARLLAEGVAQRESDIDVVWLNGYNWPRHTGGPMFYAREIGLDAVCSRLEAIGREPSEALRQLGQNPPPWQDHFQA